MRWAEEGAAVEKRQKEEKRRSWRRSEGRLEGDEAPSEARIGGPDERAAAPLLDERVDTMLTGRGRGGGREGGG
jgi:hypothetical protein